MAGTIQVWLRCLATTAMLAGTIQIVVAEEDFGFTDSEAEADARVENNSRNSIGLNVQSVKATQHPVQAGEKVVEVEVVKERYPNRSVKIERHVSLDEKRNFVNHGQWTMYSPNGTMVARGDYWRGKRQGKWTRWYADDADSDATEELSVPAEGEEAAKIAPAAPLTGPEFDGFRRPFVSQANFVEGKLVGVWTIVDSDDRPICSFEFDQDQLHGAAVSYYPNGQKRRQMEFEKGVLVGEWKEWASNGTVSKIDTYVDGRRKVPYTERYDSSEKYCQGHYLYAKAVVNVKHDWWTGAIDIQLGDDSGEKLKQGLWTYWYRNGGKMTEGEFEAGQPSALHVWWYENGQQKAQGEYLNGHQTGNWTWWHENGLKKTEGLIVDGRKTGMWSEWKEDGSLVQERAHGGMVSAQVPDPQPQARTTRPMMNRRR